MKDSAESLGVEASEEPGLRDIPGMIRPGGGLTNYLRSCLNLGLNVLGGGAVENNLHFLKNVKKQMTKKEPNGFII